MKRHWTFSLLLAAATIGLIGCGANADMAEDEIGPDGEAITATADQGAEEDGGLFDLPWPSEPETATLPAGTMLKVRTTSTLSTKSTRSGEEFVAHIVDAITIDGKTAVPAGTAVRGVVVDADEGGRVKGTASLTVQLRELELATGSVNIETGSVARVANATKKDDATKIGVGAGIGAAIGAIAGGGKGAAIGAASGAGAGTGVVLATRGEPAEIGAESVLTFELRSPVTVELEG